MWGKLIVTVIVAVVVQHVVRLVFVIHAFQATFNHAPGPCRRLPSVVHGAEDVSLLPNGLLYVSSGFGRPGGKLLRFDFESESQDTEEFKIEGDIDASSLSPHGISTWRNPKTGEVTLFVVNHHKDGERVEVFRHDGSKQSKVLKHERTIKDPKITYLNDLVATGPNSFYATIFTAMHMTLEYLLMYPGGGVLHYDDGKVRVLETGIRMANGINISPDNKYLYVVEGGKGLLRSYTINHDNSIALKQSFSFGTGLDNIEVNPETGELWIGSHPNGYKVAMHLSYPEADYPTPSQVLRATVNEGTITSVREVYSNDGTELRGSTVGVPYKNKLFIGTVIEGALVCDLIYPG